MHPFFKTLPKNIVKAFEGQNIVWHILAIFLTIAAVTTTIDWGYFEITRNPTYWLLAFPAVVVGAILPIIVPVIMIGMGIMTENRKIGLSGWALGQAGFIGWLISSAYKAISGRIPPELYSRGVDLSHHFQFGFWNGGIFWGWPSSHTAVAFAMSVAFIVIFPKHRQLRILAILYAIYIGLGVSVTVHWLSDFVAGAIIGSVIGIVVGKSFRALMDNQPKV